MNKKQSNQSQNRTIQKKVPPKGQRIPPGGFNVLNKNIEVIDYEHEEKNFYACEVEAKGIDIVTNMFYAQMEDKYFLDTTVIHLNNDKGILNIEMWATKEEKEEIMNYLSSFNDLLIREF